MASPGGRPIRGARAPQMEKLNLDDDDIDKVNIQQFIKSRRWSPIGRRGVFKDETTHIYTHSSSSLLAI